MAKTQIKTFLPARLVKGHRWYIVFYQLDPSVGERVRIRETYDLNRIPDLIERAHSAELLISQINAKLPFGFPFEEAFKADASYTNILDAIGVAEGIKCNTDRPRTVECYKSTAAIFCEFIKLNQWEDMNVGAFERKHAMAYMDYAVFDRGVGNRTYNNYLERTRALFKELLDRDYIRVNPFADFKKKKHNGKERRAFSDTEKDLVIKEIAKKDKWLLLAILLQYYCFIRPIELLRLQFYMIDLKEGLIRLPADITKNKQNSIVTIPDVLLPILKRYKLHTYDQSWVIFGVSIQPHTDKAAGRNTMNARHARILKELRKDKKILDIKGLSLYSWKDTGALELFKKKVNPLEIMKQLRHNDLATTQLYCQSLYNVNREIKALDNDLIGEELLGILV